MSSFSPVGVDDEDIDEDVDEGKADVEDFLIAGDNLEDGERFKVVSSLRISCDLEVVVNDIEAAAEDDDDNVAPPESDLCSLDDDEDDDVDDAGAPPDFRN